MHPPLQKSTTAHTHTHTWLFAGGKRGRGTGYDVRGGAAFLSMKAAHRQMR